MHMDSAIYTHKNILQFDVSVHYLVCMEEHQSHAELPHGQNSISLREMLTMQNSIKQVCSLDEEDVIELALKMVNGSGYQSLVPEISRHSQ